MQYKWTVLTVTTVGVLMFGLDSRIVIVGLPQVASALGADAEQAIWFTQAYIFGGTIALLLIGKTADIVGRVKTYNAGFIIFTIGSLLTGLSNSPFQVIIFRLLQGIGSGLIFTNSAALITDSTPPRELGFSLGINQMAFRIGSITALTVSGVILSFFDWRALFLVNVPIGIFGTYWSYKRLREVETLHATSHMDWIGFATSSISISALLLALTFQAYGLSDLNIVYLLYILAFLALIGFVLQEVKSSDPLVDLRLLRIPEFAAASLSQLLNEIAWGALLLLLSLYFQIGRGMSPLAAGLEILPFEFAFLMTGPISGRLSDRLGRTPFMLSGLIVQTIALFLFSFVGMETPIYVPVIIMVVFGAGVGVFGSPNASSIMGAVPQGARGIASGLRALLLNFGYAVSLSLAVLLMTTVIPYDTVSMLISENVGALSQPDRLLFIGSLRQTYLWLALIDGLAIIPIVFLAYLNRKRRGTTSKFVEYK